MMRSNMSKFLMVAGVSGVGVLMGMPAGAQQAVLTPMGTMFQPSSVMSEATTFAAPQASAATNGDDLFAQAAPPPELDETGKAVLEWMKDPLRNSVPQALIGQGKPPEQYTLTPEEQARQAAETFILDPRGPADTVGGVPYLPGPSGTRQRDTSAGIASFDSLSTEPMISYSNDSFTSQDGYAVNLNVPSNLGSPANTPVSTSLPMSQPTINTVRTNSVTTIASPAPISSNTNNNRLVPNNITPGQLQSAKLIASPLSQSRIHPTVGSKK
jgi:hypothetical protein